MYDELIERFCNDKGFIKSNGFKIISLTSDEAKVEYPIVSSGLNPEGIVHGGLIFGLADTTAGILGCTTFKFPLTTSANINYLRKCDGTKLIAEAHKLKYGKSIGYYIVNIYNDHNVLVATSNVNMYFTDINI